MPPSRIMPVLALAAFLNGCAGVATFDMPDTALSPTPTHLAIEKEMRRLVSAHQGVGAAYKGADWTTMTVKKGDTVLSMIRDHGASESLYYDLPAGDRAVLSNLVPTDQIAFITPPGRKPVGLAVKRKKGWDIAYHFNGRDYRLERNASVGQPRYQVMDIRLRGSLSATLAGADLDAATQETIRETLAISLSRGWPSKGWLRLRLSYPQFNGRDAGSAVLLSAALASQGNVRFIVGVRDKATGALSYYDGMGHPIQGSLGDRRWIAKPVNGTYRISSEFNPHRRHPVTGRVRPHNGRDFAAPTGTPIIAASGGTIIQAGRKGSWGKLIVIDHGGGLITKYAHLSRVAVKRGQQVASGEHIGAIGSTGMSTGPHLHFEVHYGGAPRDPSKFTPPLAQIEKAQTSGLLDEEQQTQLAAYRDLEVEHMLANLDQPSLDDMRILSFDVDSEQWTGLGGPDDSSEDYPFMDAEAVSTTSDRLSDSDLDK